MREWCLITALGTVVNMSQTRDGNEPELNDYQKTHGLKWVPARAVPMTKMREYQYWSERP